MATTKIIKVKVNPKATIKYVTNPEKTDGKILVSYEGCTEENASVMFDLALQGKRKQRKDSVLAYHLIQSFSPEDDLSPEKAHEIGEQFMEQLFHGKYSFVCATHRDKKHLHNHFVICAAERGMTGRKLNDDLALLHKIQRVNDRLCKENRLSVITQKRGRGKKHNEWQMEQETPGSSQKARLQKMVDEAIQQAYLRKNLFRPKGHATKDTEHPHKRNKYLEPRQRVIRIKKILTWKCPAHVIAELHTCGDSAAFSLQFPHATDDTILLCPVCTGGQDIVKLRKLLFP